AVRSYWSSADDYKPSTKRSALAEPARSFVIVKRGLLFRVIRWCYKIPETREYVASAQTRILF
ncbi:MAG: hypothetical protein AAGD11_15805, partial [Planctomycetota bacterium]